VKKILFSLMTMVLVVGLVGAGAFAYFSDSETSSNNQYTAGTMDLEVNDENPWASAIWTSPDSVAPGDPEEVTILKLENLGTTGALYVVVRGIDLTQIDNGYNEAEGSGSSNNIADYIYLSTIGYTESTSGTDTWIESSGYFDENLNWVSSGMLAWYETVYGSSPLKLSDFVDSYAMVFWIGAWESGTDYLPPSEAFDQKVKLGFLFDPEAGNDYQSDRATFKIRVEAYQTYDQITLLGKGSGCHGYID
jgi:predicted ribosomally synthesized peptide with SipW-like signal peptide